MRKGFTLVELLVVIAIIGILGTVAYVNIQSAKELANKEGYKMVCQNLESKKIVDNAFCE